MCSLIQCDGTVPVVTADRLGDPLFLRDHGVRAAYVAGAMAGGIASVELVVAMAKAGLLAFFGSGGLPLPAVDAELFLAGIAVKRREREAIALELERRRLAVLEPALTGVPHGFPRRDSPPAGPTAGPTAGQ